MANIILPFGAAGKSYAVDKSLRLRAANSAYLSHTPAVAGNRQIFSFACWLKGAPGKWRTLYSANAAGTSDYFALRGSGSVDVVTFVGGDGTVCALESAGFFRDPSAWSHFLLTVDTTQAVAADRVKIYVDGVRIASFSSASYPAQNTAFGFNNAAAQYIGKIANQSVYCEGHLAAIHTISGAALTPGAFGRADPATGQFVPIRYTGVFGARDSFLDFADAASGTTLAQDRSGGGNHWTANGISVAAGAAFDQSSDTPTNNHAIVFPIDGPQNNGARSFTDAGLKIVGIASAANQAVGFASLWVTPDFGGFYFEAMPQNLESSTSSYIGIAGPVCFYAPNGQYWNGTSWSSYGAAYSTGDVIGVAANMAAGELEFFKNGVGQGKKTGIAYSPSAVFPYFSAHSSSAVPAWTLNFGQRPFVHTPPAGMKALNARNMTLPPIKRASDGMRVLLDTGANIKGACEAAYPGADFLALIKDRANANNWQAIDTVRGTSAALQTNTTAAETTYSAPSGNSVGYVWKRDAAYGFDIVTYTGTGAARTVAHALGAVPHLIIVKPRGGTIANGWRVYHRSLASAANYLQLNSTAAQDTYSDWNGTAPTATVFSVNGAPAQTTNENGTGYVAYLWTEIPGFSRIGAYTGNGSSDGIFVWCGFKPRFVLIKSNTGATSWMIYDGARNRLNAADLRLAPNVTNAEASSGAIDFLANGFKLRANDANTNGGATGYVFAAFAEAPFKYATAR